MSVTSNAAPILPSPRPVSVSNGITLLPPLSRKGVGPGIILLVPDVLSDESSLTIKSGVPSPLIKWAEEGYTVVQIRQSAFSTGYGPIGTAIRALSLCSECQPQDKVGLVCYDPLLFQRNAAELSGNKCIVGAVIYTDTTTGLLSATIPTVQHVAGKPGVGCKLPRTAFLTAYNYDKVSDSLFATPFTPQFDYAVEAVSHTRSLSFLKRHDVIGGPIFDLEEIWDEHTFYEFEARDVPKTMSTMVQEPYVNHIPTMTGGIGREALTDFYTNHFVFQNPQDTELELISRTVGVDRLVDEFIFKFTHDRTIDWLLPGLPATGKYCEVPLTAIINIRGDRLYHEHIAWDQGTLLRQVGLLPEYLPWPHARPGGFVLGEQTDQHNSDNEYHRLEYQLPVTGRETAVKLRNKNDARSNEMFALSMRKCSVPK